MAVRPSWEGHLRLSLVTCPVALYPATSEAETVRFNLINPETNNRIKMKTVDAGTGEEVSRGDLVKGFEIAKGEYVLLDKEELDAVKLESTRIIDIEKFVPRASIDRLYWDTPYHLVPGGKTGIEAFAVIRAAMDQAEHGGDRPAGDEHARAHLRASRSRKAGWCLTTLRTAEEVRGIDEIGAADLPKPDPQMLADRREDRRAAVGRVRSRRVRRPLRGRPARDDRGEAQGQAGQAVGQAANDDSKVIDLMAALKKSLGAGAERRPAAGSKPAAGGKKKPNGRRAA